MRILSFHEAPWILKGPTNGAKIISFDGKYEISVKPQTCHCSVCGHMYTEAKAPRGREMMACTASTCGDCCGDLCT